MSAGGPSAVIASGGSTVLSEGERSSVAEPSTPTIRGALRKWRFWISVVIVVLIIAGVGVALTGTAKAGVAFSPLNPAPGGSMAVAEVLKSQNVQLATPSAFAAAESALRASTADTLFLYDPEGRLSDSRLRELAGLARSVVLFTPTFTQLQVLAPEVGAAGPVTRASLSRGCSVQSASRADAVSGEGMGYRIVATDSGSVGCFTSGKGVFSLIEVPRGDQIITVLGTTDAITNEHVTERSNAALALAALGQNDTLVWYLPTIDDAVAGPSLAALTPPWVGSVSALLIIVALTATLWRGRRFGPLVIERLPVVVRASETMEGRARLYQRNGARLRALDALRIGSVGRLAKACGLPRVASLEQVIQAVAVITGRDLVAVRSLLVEADPLNDRDLVKLSDALLELESAVARDIRPA